MMNYIEFMKFTKDQDVIKVKQSQIKTQYKELKLQVYDNDVLLQEIKKNNDPKEISPLEEIVYLILGVTFSITNIVIIINSFLQDDQNS